LKCNKNNTNASGQKEGLLEHTELTHPVIVRNEKMHLTFLWKLEVVEWRRWKHRLARWH